LEIGSKVVATAAIKMALTTSRQEEGSLKKFLWENAQVRAVAVDYGGEFIGSVGKIVERSVVAAKREGVIKETHADEGAVAGAAREALAQIMPKALGPATRTISVLQYLWGLDSYIWMKSPLVLAIEPFLTEKGEYHVSKRYPGCDNSRG